MSSYTSVSSHSVDAQVQLSREFADSLSLNTQHLPTTQFDPTLLSPYNQSRRGSSSTSTPYNLSSTPVESLSDHSNIGSDYSDFEDEFFGVDFDAGVHRIDSLPASLTTYPSTTTNNDLQGFSTNFESQKSSEAPISTSTTYPLSPKDTSIADTPSPRSEIDDNKAHSFSVVREFDNEVQHSGHPYPTLTSDIDTLQLTPDNSGSSHTSAEGVEPTSMPFRSKSPHVTVSHWVDEQPTAEPSSYVSSGNQYGEPITADFPDYQFPSQSMGHNARTTAMRDGEGMWQANDMTGQSGLGPEERKLLSNTEMPSLKQQETQRDLNDRIVQVQMWQSRGNGISDPNEPRSRDSIYRALTENGNIGIVDDAASIRENKLLDNQVYYNIKGTPPTEVDHALMSQPRQFSDPAALPYMTETNHLPSTANDAIQKWNGSADTFSIISRAATWGTRRRSEPSLMDYEAVADGSFLKKLSIKQERKGQNSNFAERLADMVRKKSSSNLNPSRDIKRQRSSSTLVGGASKESMQKSHPLSNLAPPPRTSSFGKSKKPTPSLNTAMAAMVGPLAAVGTGQHTTQHTRNGSISATSPRSPLHLVPSFVRSRNRSSSELGNLWSRQGGPPVPNLGSKSAVEMHAPQIQPQQFQPPQDTMEQDEDDEDDDEQGDESDLRIESGHSEPIVPTIQGFKDHVRRLNPDMDPKYNWLVSRIAHQQEIRYKNLLDLRIKHEQSTRSHICAAKPHCLALGGSATLYDTKGKPRDVERSAGGLQLVTDFSDDSNPGEGALSSETFPKGVPMPPTRNLPAVFECQLCFKAKKFQKPSDWTKHVHEDVQPFTCTYDKCREPKSFKRKADWVRHENERHRHLEWWICQMEDCRHPCYRKDNFLQHLVREHKLPEPKQKTKAAIKKARLTEPAWVMLERCHHETTNKPQDEPCKFCGKSFTTWKKLTVHLAKHMEHISLPVLRLVELKNVDADTIISPVEQNLTPVTPIPMNKLEDLSPYSMGTVSPNIAMPQYTTGLHPTPPYSAVGTSPTYGVHPVMSQDISNNQYPMYADAFNIQQMNQPRQFGNMDVNSLGNMQPAAQFGSNPNFNQSQVDQNRGFGSIENAFAMQPAQTFNQVPEFAMNQGPFVNTSSPATAFETQHMLAVNDASPFTFDGLPMQNFQQVPMSRAHGSTSSYGHSPQNMQHSPQNMHFFGQQ